MAKLNIISYNNKSKWYMILHCFLKKRISFSHNLYISALYVHIVTEPLYNTL